MFTRGRAIIATVVYCTIETITGQGMSLPTQVVIKGGAIIDMNTAFPETWIPLVFSTLFFTLDASSLGTTHI
jgi:hypothetical protein